jgi:hypothetical protein
MLHADSSARTHTHARVVNRLHCLLPLLVYSSARDDAEYTSQHSRRRSGCLCRCVCVCVCCCYYFCLFSIAFCHVMVREEKRRALGLIKCADGTNKAWQSFVPSSTLLAAAPIHRPKKKMKKGKHYFAFGAHVPSYFPAPTLGISREGEGGRTQDFHQKKNSNGCGCTCARVYNTPPSLTPSSCDDERRRVM